MAQPAPAIDLDLTAMKRSTAAQAPAVELTPAEVLVRTTWRDPKTGTMRTLEALSKVPIDKAHLARATASQCRGLPWGSFAPIDVGRFAAIARVALQLELPDKGAEWFTEALAVDEDLCFELEAALTEHERRYFRGNAPEGSKAPPAARVAIPCFATPRPGGTGE